MSYPSLTADLAAELGIPAAEAGQLVEDSRRMSYPPHCTYRDCSRARVRGWTTCPRHKTAGRALAARDKR